MTDLKIMETVWIHQPSGNPMMGAPADPTDEQFAPIEIVGIIDWLAAEGFELMDFEASAKALKVYLQENPEVTYWSESKENFFVTVAAREAYESGHTTVIVENLS
jgi:hypothetical protein